MEDLETGIKFTQSIFNFFLKLIEESNNIKKVNEKIYIFNTEIYNKL